MKPLFGGRDMSWPHILSFSRIIAGPIVAALVLGRPGDTYLAAALIFALASFTDLVDGKLARHSRRASPLGVFLDTTSDKVMVSLTLVAMAVAGLAAAWIPLVIIGREFLISGLRSFAASSGHIISAHLWGKGKSAVTMVAIFFVLIAADGRAGGSFTRLTSHARWSDAFTAASWLLGVAAALTIVSGVRYLVDAWPLLRAGEEAEEPPRVVAGKRRA
jgi:CDP-diacylglycerol---glycerol-3-phosphate 3-phosphatidyltransferase